MTTTSSTTSTCKIFIIDNYYHILNKLNEIDLSKVKTIVKNNILLIKINYNPFNKFSFKWKITIISISIFVSGVPILYHLFFGTIIKILLLLSQDICIYLLTYICFIINNLINQIIKNLKELKPLEEIEDIKRKINPIPINISFYPNESIESIFKQFHENAILLRKKEENLFPSPEIPKIIALLTKIEIYNTLLNIYKRASKAYFELIKETKLTVPIFLYFHDIKNMCMSYIPKLSGEELQSIKSILSHLKLDQFTEQLNNLINNNFQIHLSLTHYHKNFNEFFSFEKDLNDLFNEMKKLSNSKDRLNASFLKKISSIEASYNVIKNEILLYLDNNKELLSIIEHIYQNSLDIISLDKKLREVESMYERNRFILKKFEKLNKKFKETSSEEIQQIVDLKITSNNAIQNELEELIKLLLKLRSKCPPPHILFKIFNDKINDSKTPIFIKKKLSFLMKKFKNQPFKQLKNMILKGLIQSINLKDYYQELTNTLQDSKIKSSEKFATQIATAKKTNSYLHQEIIRLKNKLKDQNISITKKILKREYELQKSLRHIYRSILNKSDQLFYELYSACSKKASPVLEEAFDNS